jgi:hypothetical protein
MTFFYDLNKRLAQLADKQDAKQISEDVKASAPKSQLAEAVDVAEAGYSAKAGRAGKDLGKPGKNFSKIAKGAAERYGSKAAGERVAGAVLNKLRHPKEDQEVEESAFQAAIGKKKYGEKGMKALQKAGREHASAKTMSNIRNRYDKYDEGMGIADEGNAFTGKLDSTPKGGKFKMGNKEYTDTSSIEEGSMKHMMHKDAERMSREKFCSKYGDEYGEFWDNIMGNLDEGFKEMDAWLASREKEKGTGRFDKKKISTGTVYTRKPETFDDPETDPEATGGAPARRGRPKGKDKGPERVTAKSYKYKAGRPTKTKEDLDSDGVLMTRPTNCSSESIDPGEQAEYNDEAGMTKDSLHTIVRSAKELERALRSNKNLPEWVQEKIGQIKGMMSSVTDYMLSTHERDAEQHMEPVAEKSVSKAQRKFMGMAHAMQKGEKIKGASPELKKVAKTMKPSDTRDFATTKEKGLPKKVKKADEGKGDGNLANNAKPYDKVTQGDVVAGRLGKDEMGGKKKKEDKVDETTVAGSVATAPAAAKKSSGGMQFGKGVYEGFNNQVESMITEGMNISVNMNAGEDGETRKSITVSADGAEADQLAALLKMAGLQGQSEEACGTCGQAPCGCEQTVDEAYGDTDETLNDPDWPTDTETLAADPELRTYSGGLNGPKSTGQTTIPVVASQERRLHSMEESAELERSLFKTWKNYKG